jgi:serine/threonine protein kinase
MSPAHAMRSSQFMDYVTTTTGARLEPRLVSDSVNGLPAGCQLHEFKIEQVIGEGGFGIVYLAQDTQLHRTVAVKEYVPHALATRAFDNSLALRSERHRETFQLGLSSFVNEARLLASFDHPSLVKVYRFWEQNGTAYMAMPYYRGPTLKVLLQNAPCAPDEAWLKKFLHPLLDALQVIHNSHCYHRDIAPDNILLLGSGTDYKPLLLDFGAARRVIQGATQNLTVILKPGYAPVEQYAEVASMKQGPWTDIYALCAVLYAAITGQAPLPSVGRLIKDEMTPVSQQVKDQYSAAFLLAIDHGLAVRPEDRTQNVAALRASLLGEAGAGHSTTHATTYADDMPTVPPPALPIQPLKPLMSASVQAEPSPAAPLVGAPRTVLATPRKPRWLWAASLAAVVAVAGSAAFFVAQQVAELEAKNNANGLKEALNTVPQSTNPSVNPNVNPSVNPSTKQAAAALAIPVAAATAPPLPTAAADLARPAFSLVNVLNDIVSRSDPSMSVNTLADQQNLVIGQDAMQFRVKSSEAGYLYVFHSGTDGGSISLLFPNARDADNRITADTQVVLPRKGWKITAAGPAGVNHIVTMVSRTRRDFGGIGLKPSSGVIREFDTTTLQRLWVAAPLGVSPYERTPRCAAGVVPTAATNAAAANCDAGYGATLLRITEVTAPAP